MRTPRRPGCPRWSLPTGSCSLVKLLTAVRAARATALPLVGPLAVVMDIGTPLLPKQTGDADLGPAIAAAVAMVDGLSALGNH